MVHPFKCYFVGNASLSHRESLKGEHSSRLLFHVVMLNVVCVSILSPSSLKSISLSGASGVHDFICLITSSLGNAGFVSETTRMCWANTTPSQAASGLTAKASYARKLPRSCFLMRSSLMIRGCLLYLVNWIQHEGSITAKWKSCCFQMFL